MGMPAALRIMPRVGVRDPQGEAVAEALAGLGFTEVRSVRQGKLIELEIDAPDAETAFRRLNEMADALLVNKVVEDVEIELYE